MNSKLPIPSIRLLKQLSRNIYSSFKVGLKEIIINSFDAGSNNVDISINSSNNTIIINDDGIGMNQDEIFKYFLKAGSTTKKGNISSTRPIIGYKGIGVFSLFFFADEIIIKSKKINCDPIKCSVNLTKIKNIDEMDDSINSIDVLEWDKKYSEDKIGTIIEIKGIEKEAFETIWNNDLKIKDQILSKYLSEVLPVHYSHEDKGLNLSNYLKEENEQLTNWDFNIKLNGQKILRQTPYYYFEKKNILDQMYIKEFEKQINENISIKAVLFAGIKKIKDNNISGFLIRNNNIAIGSRKDNPFNLRSRIHMLQWVSGEILINGDINEIITTDRERLVEDNDIFQALKDVVYDEISPFLSELKVNLEKNKTKKDKEKEKEESQKFENSLNQYVDNKSPNKAFKLKEFKDNKKSTIVEYNEKDKTVEINKSSKAANKFSKWSDKELFYSFLALLQNKASSEGNECCKEIINQVQEEFDDFVAKKDRLKKSQTEFGF